MNLLFKYLVKILLAAQAMLLLTTGLSYGADRVFECRGLFARESKPRFIDPSFEVAPNGKVTLKVTKGQTLTEKIANVTIGPLVHRFSGLNEIETWVTRRLLKDHRQNVHYYNKVLDAFNITYSADAQRIADIPKSGPLIVFANHPLSGPGDGLTIASAVSKVRGDVKIVLNSFLKDLPGLAEHAIFVDPMGDAQAKKYNESKRKEIEDYVRSGGAIVIFPAGSVSVKLNVNDKFAVDEPWKNSFIKIAEKVSGTMLLPIYVNATSSDVVHYANRIAPYLKSATLLKEISNQIDSHVELKIESPVKAEDLRLFKDYYEKSEYLRNLVYQHAETK